tara:strand:+ start:3873 stop:4634 length:762 start_codon:yes stop_codon:yes gene_type:complete
MAEYSHLQHIYKSIKENYKNWFVMIISCIIMSYKTSIFYGAIQYISCIFWVYVAHVIAHEPLGFFLNRAHIYHHENTDWISHLIQVGVELSASFGPVMLLYYFIDMDKQHKLVDPYIYLTFFLFYTSTHNINYGMLKVNQVHYNHHLDYSVNYGPDICDIIFKTKYPYDGIENTDHYIPNIILSTMVSYFFKIYYNQSNHKTQIKKLLVVTYFSVLSIVGYFTLKQSIIDLHKLSEKEINLFIGKINNIKSLL